MHVLNAQQIQGLALSHIGHDLPRSSAKSEPRHASAEYVQLGSIRPSCGNHDAHASLILLFSSGIVGLSRAALGSKLQVPSDRLLPSSILSLSFKSDAGWLTTSLTPLVLQCNSLVHDLHAVHIGGRRSWLQRGSVSAAKRQGWRDI